MNILLMVHDMVYPNKGGGASRVDATAKAFKKMGHNVYLFAPIGADVKEAERALGYNIIPAKHIYRKDKNKMFKYILYSQILMLKVPLLIKRYSIDLVFVHDSIYGFPALFGSKLLGKPIIFDATDLIAEYSESWFLKLLGRFVEKHIIIHADKIITVSNAMKRILGNMGAQNIDVVYDGVDRSVFRPVTVDERNEFTLVFEGGMDPQDGLDIIIPTAEKVVKRIPHAKFLFVGDGRVVPQIKERAKRKGLENNFEFTGWVRYEDVASYISSADVGLVIMPDLLSAKIRVTLKVFEYWACGKPIIAAGLDALMEIINKKNGLLYEADNPTDLADKIIRIYEDRELREYLCEAGMKEVVDYDWNILGGKIARLSLSTHISKKSK